MKTNRKSKRWLESMLALMMSTGVCTAANLLDNPSFETWNDTNNLPSAVSRWRLPKGGISEFAVFERSAAENHDGKYSLHLKDIDKGNKNHTLGYILKKSELDAIRGKVLYFSGWVKQVFAQPSRNVGLGIYVETASGGRLGTNSCLNSTGPTDWTQSQTKIQIPEDVSNVVAFIYCANGYHNTGEAYFDSLYLGTDKQIIKMEPPSTDLPSSAYQAGVPVAAGEPLLRLYNPILPGWTVSGFGGLTFAPPAGMTPELHIQAKTDANAYCGIKFITKMINRNFDLTEVGVEHLSLTFCLSRRIAVQVAVGGGSYTTVNECNPLPDGRFRYVLPLKQVKGLKLDRIGDAQLQFMENVTAGEMILSDFCIVSDIPSKTPQFYTNAELEAYRKSYTSTMIVKDDGAERPEIKNGTWYYQGHPIFWVGGWLYNHNDNNWGPKANPLNIDHPAYTMPPSTELFKKVGFNSSQISGAHAMPGQVIYGCGIPDNYEDVEKQIKEYYTAFAGTPMVLDFAFGYHRAINSDDSVKYSELNQRNGSWHSFIPLCPEHPEGDHYYKGFYAGGVKSALKNHCNVFLYELFNESSYNCQCKFNAWTFSREMERLYGTIEKANEQWKTLFDSFDEVASVTNFQQYRKMWPDWCKFNERRYAEILKKYKNFIREIDQRDNIYFCEQASGAPPARVGMNYRLIADALDVVASEGGWRYGFNSDFKAKNEMEEVVVSGVGSSHWYNCDFYQALTKGVKPYVNDEHYCTRLEHGKRVPSHKEDMITSLWCELMHGSSGNFTYCWDKRAWEWRTYEEAKNNVINPSYKSSSMMNPYNWPPSELEAFNIFQAEMSPYKDLLLPFPRVKPATVAIFYSYPTQRMSPYLTIKQAQKMLNWYGAALHAQYPVKLVFEEELAAGLGDDVQALLIPCAHYATPETLENVNALAKKGMLVIADSDAFQWDEYSNPLQSKVDGSIVRLSSDDSGTVQKVRKLLNDKKIKRYSVLEPLDGKGHIELSDVQIIDRGDFKLVFAVAMNDLGSRLANLRIFTEDKGEFFAYDLVGKRLLRHGKKSTWTSEELSAGMQVILPSQERVLIILQRQAPEGIEASVDGCDRQAEYAQIVNLEEPRVKAYHEAVQLQLKSYQQARMFDDVKVEACKTVDMRPFVTTGFMDEIAGDQKGGWFDQGNNDLRNMTTGRQILAGVPFDVIDAASNGGKSCIVLYGTPRTYFPKEVKGIAVDDTARNVYFLHTKGWDQAGIVMYYTVNYTDGTSEVIPIETGKAIGGWWGTPKLTEAKIAAEVPNMERATVNVQAFRWSNPHPDRKIKSIDVRSNLIEGVPALLAITLEK